MDKSKTVTKLAMLKDYYDLECHNLLCYSATYGMNTPKAGWEQNWQEAKAKVEMLKALIKEEGEPAPQFPPFRGIMETIRQYVEDVLSRLEELSTDGSHISPRPGCDEKWREAKARLDQLTTIHRIIEKEYNKPIGNDRTRMAYLVETLLSKSASVHFVRLDGQVAQLRIMDDAQEKMIAILNFEDIGGHYRLAFYQLL